VIAVTIDTSVYVAILNSRTAGSRLFQLARSGRIRIDTSEAMVSETVRVLRDVFAWNPYRIQDFKQTLRRIANHVTPAQSVDAIQEDPADNRILECAAEAGSVYILTWDKDLLRLGHYGRAQITTLPAFLRTMDLSKI
jgi:uncharacterized protein